MSTKVLTIFIIILIVVAIAVYYFSYKKGFEIGFEAGKKVSGMAVSPETAVENPLKDMPSANPFGKLINPFKGLYINPFK